MMNQTRNFDGWKYYKNDSDVNVGIMIIHQNGTQESISLNDKEVAQWLAEGNEPLPADE